MRFFQKYQETFIIILTIAFLGILISYFIWGTTQLATNINKAVTIIPGSAADAGFHISDAAKLDFRGNQ